MDFIFQLKGWQLTKILRNMERRRQKKKKKGLIKYAVPFISSLVLLRGPTTAVLGNNADVGVVAFVLSLQAGQVGWRGHTPADCNFAQTLKPMSGSN